MKQIVVVGGGSAGWITAGLLAARYSQESDYQITIVESPEVNSIGVGEGTWPSMRDTLQQLGLSEVDFMQASNASFKQGSTFFGWTTGDANDRYHHPFTVPSGYSQSDLHSGWLALASNQPFADCVGVQSHVCTAGLAPKQYQTPEYAGVTNYGYHFDADKFIGVLSEHCQKKLGVKRVAAHIEQVEQHSSGDIAAVITQSGQSISGDFFIDCSGMQALLIGKTLGVEWHSQCDVLFNDRALALRVDYPTAQTDIASTTLATAHANGWVWDIGLSSRKGVGCVFSSNFSDAENAERVLCDYLQRDDIAEFNPRLLKFDPGYRQHIWSNNCLAVGMSAGFLEPLEASALAMVELTANMLCDNLPALFTNMPLVRDRFNQRFTYRWQRVVEFLKLHYAISQRTDSEYWHANRATETIPERLIEQLSLWRNLPPSRYDFFENEEVFSSASYQYVLYGMHYETTNIQRRGHAAHLKTCGRLFQENRQYVNKLYRGLPSNRDWLAKVIGGPLANIGKSYAANV